MMKPRALFLILIASLINFQSAWADSPKLSSKTSAESGTVSISLSRLKKSGNCLTTVYGSQSNRTLLRDASSGTKLLTTKNSKSKINFSVNGLQFSNNNNRRLYLRAEQVCAESREQSNLSTLKFGQSGSDDLSVNQFIISIRQAVLKSSFKFAQVFVDKTFDTPVDFRQADKRTLIVEQSGKIKAVIAGTAVTTEELFLDISEKIMFGGERGLLGLAIHPRFQKNGYFFVNYSRKDDGATIISRFTAVKNGVADPASEKVLMTVAQPFRNHNGGGLAFGPDGYLYIALGDGGSGGDPLGNGQNRSTLLGKILRIDVNTNVAYLVPKSNPFVKATDGSLAEIWAFGLRNPWRISFDSKLGKLWAADVGQGAQEEVDIIRKGGNFGWKITEGNICYNAASCDKSGLIDPVFQYGRNLGQSITGGYVYRGKDLPNFSGVYFFADFVSGRLFALEKIAGTWIGTELIDTTELISSFGQDSRGEIYFLSYSTGNVFKIS